MTEGAARPPINASFLIGTGGTLAWYRVEQIRSEATADGNVKAVAAVEYVACRPKETIFMYSGTGGSREWWVGLLPKHAATAADQLRFIKRQLGLSLTDLARACHASRPTIYGWLEGQEPSLSNKSRIARLYALALKCESAFKQPLPPKLLLRDGTPAVDVVASFDGDEGDAIVLLREAFADAAAGGAKELAHLPPRAEAERADGVDKFLRMAGDISRRR